MANIGAFFDLTAITRPIARTDVRSDRDLSTHTDPKPSTIFPDSICFCEAHNTSHTNSKPGANFSNSTPFN